MYYIEIISLEGCPYSIAAEKLVENNNINNKIFKIKYNNRNDHKNERISTFPQIYLKKKDSDGRLLVGGYDKLNEIKNLIKNRKSTKETYDSLVDKISKKFSPTDDFNKKSVLRLIQLFI
tara:strand:+ start:639 stop:998 length:360 start_codon:yes stop_codon:yes gene_type:complete